ncbi:MAG TPA: acyl-CoA dehydrogenase family protein [Sphingobium sp.]|nr:acyl-CoA dehydrogenase family protein [Sphingobium sp.]
MNLDLSPFEKDFRQEVRHFFEQEYPRYILNKVASGQRLERGDHIASQRALNARGWLGISWPREHGGTGWSPMQRLIFDEELERAGAPNIIPMAVLYIGPIICAFGSKEQQERWLPDILESRSLWAQGYSEPEAGSDLASLRLEARREGDEYVLNGVKLWTSGAHWADWIFCLVRTSREARKQEGISLICLDMRSAGVRVEPIISIDGSHELNRVIFDDVRVPVANRIGEEGKAWHYANVLLENERLSYAHIGRKRAELRAARERIAAEVKAGCWSAAEAEIFLRRLSACQIEVDALEILVLRVLLGENDPALIAFVKIASTEIAQQVTELQIELAGRGRGPFPARDREDWHQQAPLVPEWQMLAAPAYLFERAQTIYGGATEIQKTIAWRSLTSRY